MPLYEYHCGKCDHDFEVLVRGNETPQCPACQSQKLEKQMSVTAAPANSTADLPVCQPRGCGLPQCGMGGCAGLE